MTKIVANAPVAIWAVLGWLSAWVFLSMTTWETSASAVMPATVGVIGGIGAGFVRWCFKR